MVRDWLRGAMFLSAETPSILSDTMHLLISFRKQTHPQNRQLNILIGNREQGVDDFVGKLTF